MDNLQIINNELNEIGYSLEVQDTYPYKEIYPQKVVLLEYHGDGRPSTCWTSYVDEKDIEFIIKEVALYVYGLCHLLGDDKTSPNEVKFTMEDGQLIIHIEKISRCTYRGRSWLVRTNIKSKSFLQHIKLTYWTDEVPYEMYDHVDGVLCTRRRDTMSHGVIDEYVAEQACLTKTAVWSEVKSLDEKIKRAIEKKESGA